MTSRSTRFSSLGRSPAARPADHPAVRALYGEFDRQALVRNDVQQPQCVAARDSERHLSQNDARKALGLNPIAGGDTYRINTALAPDGSRVNLNVA